jgi:serine/threonine protein kinase
MSFSILPHSPTSFIDDVETHALVWPRPENVIIGDKIGYGATSNAFIASIRTRDEDPTLVVAKVMKTRSMAEREFDAEIKALAAVDSPFVIKLIGADRSQRNPRLFLEYCPNGELFRAISRRKFLPEDVGRKYLRMLWEAVNDCHGAGVAHRDVKLENIFLAEDWSLRLADFGFATTGFLSSSYDMCGTEGLQAPELFKRAAYSPFEVDIWATGVTAFIIIVGAPPFIDVKNGCWYYGCVREQRWDLFWKQHEKFRDGPLLSDDVKAFLQRALQPIAHQRPTASQMLSDSYLSSMDLSDDDLRVFMEA